MTGRCAAGEARWPTVRIDRAVSHPFSGEVVEVAAEVRASSATGEEDSRSRLR